jgi:ribose transport system permease protein
MKQLLSATITGPLLALIVLILIVGLTTNRFFDPANLSNLALQVSVVSIVSIGATIVILTGGVDLSPGSAIALLTLVFAMLIKTFGLPIFIAAPAILALGFLIGALNGAIVAYLRIPSFIATLAALSGLKGLAFTLTGGAPIFSVSEDMSQIFYGTIFGAPLPFFYVVLIYGAAFVFLNLSPLGRQLYAVGGNATAARLSGINVQRIQLLAFSIAGVTYAAGAILFTARLNSGSPNYGSGMELQAIAATVIGGASLSGGRGNIFGALLGSLIIIIVQNAMNLNGVGSSQQAIIVGLIILIAVGIDMWRVEIGNALARLAPASPPRPTKGSDGL